MKTFPVIRSHEERRRPNQAPVADSIPWDVIAPHEEQALRNHCGQSLERLAERGGLSPQEALAVLEDRNWEPMPWAEARAALHLKIQEATQ